MVSVEQFAALCRTKRGRFAGGVEFNDEEFIRAELLSVVVVTAAAVELIIGHRTRCC